MENQQQFLETRTLETNNTKLHEILSQSNYNHPKLVQKQIIQQNEKINQEKEITEVDIQIENNINKSVESVLHEQEQQEEIQVNTSKYQQAQAIIQAESKQLIVTKVY